MPRAQSARARQRRSISAGREVFPMKSFSARILSVFLATFLIASNFGTDVFAQKIARPGRAKVGAIRSAGTWAAVFGNPRSPLVQALHPGSYNPDFFGRLGRVLERSGAEPKILEGRSVKDGVAAIGQELGRYTDSLYESVSVPEQEAAGHAKASGISAEAIGDLSVVVGRLAPEKSERVLLISQFIAGGTAQKTVAGTGNVLSHIRLIERNWKEREPSGNGATSQTKSLGFTTRFRTEPGLNQIVKQYHSTEDEQIFFRFLAKAVTGGIPPSGQALPSEMRQGYFNNKPIQMRLLTAIQVDGHPVAYIPSQSFLLSQTESIHKSISALASFQGYYLFLAPPEKRQDVVMADFLEEHFAQIQFSGLRNYLIPIEQYYGLKNVMHGRLNSAWDYDQGTQTSPRFRPSQPQPSLHRTAGRTYYDFRSDGTVVVYHRDGTIKKYSFNRHNSIQGRAYASHKAILARQGIVVTSDDPVEAIHVGLSRTKDMIKKYGRKAGVSSDSIGVYQYKLDTIRQRLDASLSQENVQAVETVVGELMRLARNAEGILPSSLQWSNTVSETLLRAPVVKGKPVVRIIRPFLLIRHSLTNVWAQHDFRVISDKILHMMPLYAHLGQAALTLEKLGLIAGGHLAYEYDAWTGELKRVILENNGMIALSARGEHKLTSEEIADLAKGIRDNIPHARQGSIAVVVAAK